MLRPLFIHKHSPKTEQEATMTKGESSDVFFQDLRRIASNPVLVNRLQEDRSLEPFFALQKQGSDIFDGSCTSPYIRKAITNAINRILQTNMANVFYMHVSNDTESPCDGWLSRTTPRTRCGPAFAWQIGHGKNPQILSTVRQHMTHDMRSGGLQKIEQHQDAVQACFNESLWPPLCRYIRAFFRALYGKQEVRKDDIDRWIYQMGLYMLRCILAAVICDRKTFYKYQPLLFAFRYGIPLEQHPHQPSYLTLLVW